MNAAKQLRIHVVSDLHLEFADTHVNQMADVIVLAGDIGVGMQGLKFAADVLKTFPGHIIYVAGNHEFYGYDINDLKKAMRDFCRAEPRLHFLDDDEVVIDGVRFLGATLWTDFDLFGEGQKQTCITEGRRLNDFRLIRNGYRNFSVRDSIDLHAESVKWLEMKLKREPFDGTTVVVTHHAPSYKSVVERYRDDMLSACFASNLEHLLGYNKLWLHGHMHDSFDYTVEGTRVICNPRGYCRYEGHNENHGFNQNLLIEVS